MLRNLLCHSEQSEEPGRRIPRRLFAPLRVTPSNKCKNQKGFTLVEIIMDGKLLRDGQLIAEYIQQEGITWCDWDETTLLLTATITAQVGEEIETKTFEVKPRPDPVS